MTNPIRGHGLKCGTSFMAIRGQEVCGRRPSLYHRVYGPRLIKNRPIIVWRNKNLAEKHRMEDEEVDAILNELIYSRLDRAKGRAMVILGSLHLIIADLEPEEVESPIFAERGLLLAQMIDRVIRMSSVPLWRKMFKKVISENSR